RALLADNTGEGIVNASDLSTLSAAWLSEPGMDQWEAACDIATPMDDTIDLADLATLAGQWKRDVHVPVPVAAWHLDETTGLVAAGEAGASSGTLRGFADDDSQWVQGNIGGGLVFDGVDDFVEVEGSAGICGRQARTVTAWLQTAERSSAAMTIMAWGARETGQGFALEIDPAGRFKVTCDGGLAVAGDKLVGDKRWHHVAVVLAPLEAETPRMSDVRLYVDGLRQNLYGLIEADIDTVCDSAIRIGASHHPDDPAWFGGVIDDVRLFDLAVSAENIDDLYAQAEI
ncbi:MAG: LamG domain-containing protein, partial [Planctomycetota bacterium]